MSFDLWEPIIVEIEKQGDRIPSDRLMAQALTKRWFEVVDRIKELEAPGYRFRRIIRGIFITDQLPIDQELEHLKREREQIRRMMNDPGGWWREEK